MIEERKSNPENAVDMTQPIRLHVEPEVYALIQKRGEPGDIVLGDVALVIKALTTHIHAVRKALREKSEQCQRQKAELAKRMTPDYETRSAIRSKAYSQGYRDGFEAAVISTPNSPGWNRKQNKG